MIWTLQFGLWALLLYYLWNTWPGNVPGDYHCIKTIIILVQFPTWHIWKIWTSLKSEELIINSIKINTAARGSSISVTDHFSLQRALHLFPSEYKPNSYNGLWSPHQPASLLLFWPFCLLLILLLTLLLHTGLFTIAGNISLSLGSTCNVLKIFPWLMPSSLCSVVTLSMPTYPCDSI